MYELIYHKTLTLEKWQKFPKSQQILMIANEFNRLLNACKAQLSHQEQLRTIEKIFELLDLTINSHRKSFQKELLRLRDLIAENYIKSKSELSNSLPVLKKIYKVLLLFTSESSELI